MRPTSNNGQSEGVAGFLWDLLTFQRLLTGPILHLVYWAGLGFIFIGACGSIAASVTIASREGGVMGVLLGFSALIAALLVFAAAVLIWRMICEFYVAVFRISEDLRAIRLQNDGDDGRSDGF
jgi:hypothetical protein